MKNLYRLILRDADPAPTPQSGGTPPPPAPTPNGNPPPPPAPNGGSENRHWAFTMEGLDEGIRANPALQPYQTPAAAIKGLVDVQPLIGRDKVVLPKDWNDAAQVTEFNKRMGVPEKPELYDLGKVLTPKLPQGVTLDTTQVEGFQKMAHEAGLTPRQAAKLAETYTLTQIEQGRAAATKAEVETANRLNEYKTKVGTQYDTNVALARKALVGFGDSDTVKFLNETGLGNDPRFIELFAKIGKTLKEDTLPTDGGTPNLSTNDSDNARIRLHQMKGDATFLKKLQDPNEAGHRDAVAEWTKMHGLLNKNK